MGSFGVVDYIVFVGTLAVSLLIGVFFAFVKKQKTTDQVLVGNRDMALFPVCLSLLATYMSAILILGLAGEIYAHGSIIAEGIVGALIFIPVSGLLFLPTLYHLKLTSAYEYLELRFETKVIRLLATATFIIQITLYTGIVLHAPALALKAILDVPIWVSVVLMGGCAGLYTSVGGIRAVVWTDAFQVFMMFAGMLAIIIQGSINVGGFTNVFEIAKENQRLEFLNWTIDPFLRHSTLNIFFGNGIGWMAAYGVNQATVQRYCSMSSFRRAFLSVIFTAPLVAFTMVLGALSAIVIFANYAGCDPLTLGLIRRKDEISPFFVVQHLAGSAGLVGLYVSALFSGSLSTVSSVLNSLAAVVWEDFLKSITIFTKLSRTSQGWIVKAIALIFTVVTIGFGLIVGKLGGILTATLAINGSVAGPLLALFVLGIFFPFVNKYGAGIGMLTGLVCTFYVSLGAILSGKQPENLSFRIDECTEEDLMSVSNMTVVLLKMNATAELHNAPAPDTPYPEKLYTLSYMLYPLIGSTITIIVAVIVSLITGVSKVTKDNEKFIHPVLVWLLRKSRGTQAQTGAITLERYELSSSYVNGNGTSSLKFHQRNGGARITNSHDNFGYVSDRISDGAEMNNGHSKRNGANGNGYKF